jgi:hypothetical protein
LHYSEINEATLILEPGDALNNPWFTPPFLYLEPVDYGERGLMASDHEALEATSAVIAKYNQEIPGEIDITSRLGQAVLARKTRFQILLHMASTTNFNQETDYLEFDNAALKVSFTR